MNWETKLNQVNIKPTPPSSVTFERNEFQGNQIIWFSIYYGIQRCSSTKKQNIVLLTFKSVLLLPLLCVCVPVHIYTVKCFAWIFKQKNLIWLNYIWFHWHMIHTKNTNFPMIIINYIHLHERKTHIDRLYRL